MPIGVLLWVLSSYEIRQMGYYIIILKVTIMAKQLVKFMNDRLQREMDKLWESGEMSNEKLQEMQSEHLRTAYK